MDYIVGEGDTLERIAACNDVTPSSLIKFNRLSSRFIFPGQKLKIPGWPVVNSSENELLSQRVELPAKIRSQSVNIVQTQTFDNTGTQKRGVPKFESPESPQVPGSAIKILSPSAEQLDAECLKKFLKLKVKHFTECEGSVAGTLLVTPNCLMFDPDVSHPLVKENGADKYGMVASMDQIMSATLYKDISAFTGQTQIEKDNAEVYGRTKSVSNPLPDSHFPFDSSTPNGQLISIKEEKARKLEQKQQYTLQCVFSSPDSPDIAKVSPNMEDTELFEQNETDDSKAVFHSLSPPSRRPRFSSLKKLSSPMTNRRRKTASSTKSVNFDESTSSRDTSSSPKIFEGRFSGFRQSLKNRASSISGSLTVGAQNVACGVAAGTKAAVSSGAQTIATSTKVAADAVQSGAVNVAESLTEGAKAIGRVPHNIVNMGSGMFTPQEGDTWFSDEQDLDHPKFRRQQSQAKLDALMVKAMEKRQKAYYQFRTAMEPDDKPEIFKSVDQVLTQAHTATSPANSGPQLPFYFCVRLNRRMKNRNDRKRFATKTGPEGAFGNRMKSEFWFTIPREKAEALYTFMVQWTPEKYNSPDESVDYTAKKGDGFIVLDNEVDDELQGEDGDVTPIVGSYIQREWEIVTVEEVRRRLELDMAASELPLPEGAITSRILSEQLIRQMVDVLPARAEGYPWHRVYSSEDNGFSLRTLYRKMSEFREDLSPCVFIVEDTVGDIFGACVSLPIRQSDHFAGTGDSCFLFTFLSEHNKDKGCEKELKTYPWTGDNIYFVKADRDSLSFGSGGGHIGLWIDGDFNKGRSRTCKTFNNPPLSSTEDFVVQNIEAWCFSMDSE